MSRYVPRFLSLGDIEQLRQEIEVEFQKIELALVISDFILLPKLDTAPTKPREGRVVYADGASWDPGSGEGIYAYYAGSWKKLG